MEHLRQWTQSIDYMSCTNCCVTGLTVYNYKPTMNAACSFLYELRGNVLLLPIIVKEWLKIVKCTNKQYLQEGACWATEAN